MPLSRRAFISGLAGAAGAAAIGGVALERTRSGSSSSPRIAHGGVTTTTTLPVSSARLPSGKGTVVIVTLYGGNDGLSTVAPIDDPAYARLRGVLAIDPAKALPLADGLALAPELVGTKHLWDTGRLAIVRGVSYPNPNRSHFRSMDIWQSADPTGTAPTGWIGRWLDAAGTTPLDAIAIGSTLPRALTGAQRAGSVVPLNARAVSLHGAALDAWTAMRAPEPSDSVLMARAGESGIDLLTVADTVDAALNGAPVTPVTPATPAKGLSAQLDAVARLIRAGVPTRAFFTSMGGFDTHANEGPTHPALMADLDAAITSFFATLADDPRGDSVVVMVHSEFGRRPAIDGSGGTDHGVAAPVLVVGSAVKGGFIGDEPSLTTLDANGDLVGNVDFRSIYAALLGDVLGVDPKPVLLGAGVAPLDLIRT